MSPPGPPSPAPLPSPTVPATHGPFRIAAHGTVQVGIEPDGLRLRSTGGGRDEETVVRWLIFGGIALVVVGALLPEPLSWVLYVLGGVTFVLGGIGALALTVAGYGALVVEGFRLLTPSGRRQARAAVAGARQRWKEIRRGRLVPWAAVLAVAPVESRPLRWRSRWRVRITTVDGELVLDAAWGRRRRAESLAAQLRESAPGG